MKNKVSFDSQLTKFGIGLFETIRVEKTALDLDMHMDRMFKSIELLKLNIKYDKKFLKEAILNYIKENKIENKALRLTIFDEGYNISIRDIVYDEETYNRGYKLTISPIKRGDSIIYRHKTTNYYENIYTKRYASENNFDDGIFVNQQDIILECSMSNIFFIKEDKIYTPHRNLPILNGIMKEHIFETFYTGTNKIADSRRSLGLGLALCKSIVNVHGGEIKVSDAHPHGAVFQFTLPAGEVKVYE